MIVEFERALPLDTVQRAIENLRSCDPGTLLPTVTHEARQGLKFSDCLPPELALHSLAVRTQDHVAVERVLGSRVRLIST